MKRKISLLVSVLLICVMSVAPVFADQQIKVMLNGSQVVFPDAQPFVDENNRTQVPIRIITDMLGGTAYWNNKTRTAYIAVNGTQIEMIEGFDRMLVNDQVVYMDTTLSVKNGRTYVPAKYIADAIGASVNWNQSTKTVSITANHSSSYNQPSQPYNQPSQFDVTNQNNKINSEIDRLKGEKMDMIQEYDELIAKYEKAISDLEKDRDEQAYLAYKKSTIDYSGKGLSGSSSWATDDAQKVRDTYNKEIKKYQQIINDLSDEKENNVRYYDNQIQNLKNQLN